MSSPGLNNEMPFLIWLLAIVFAFLMYTMGFAYFYFEEVRNVDQSRENSRYEKVVSNKDIKNSMPSIWIIGSSLSNCAFDRYGSLEEARSITSAEFNYTIISRRRAVIEDFNAWIPKITDEKPDFIFLESNMICLQMFREEPRNQRSIWNWLIRYNNRLMQAPQYITAYIWSAMEIISLPVPPNTRLENKGYWDKYANQAQRYSVRGVDDFPEWTAFFENAREYGIQVCILELPRSTEAKALLSEKLYHEYDALLAQYRDLYGIRFFKYEKEMESKGFFRDAAHLNKRGAQLYTSWFCVMVNEMLKDNI